MKKSRFTEAQIMAILRQAEGGMDASMISGLEDGNRRLKKMFAEFDRIFERVMAVTKRHFVLIAGCEHAFVWPQGVDTNHFPRFRRPTGDVVRPVDEIALPELAAVAREGQGEGFEGDAALSAMEKLAGLQKLRQSSRQRFVQAMTFNI